MTSIVKTGFKGLSIPAKVQKVGQVVRSMTGNVHFANPKPALAELEDAQQALAQAYQLALDGSRRLRATMLERETELDNLMLLLAAYVQNESGGDAEKIRSSGFEVRASGYIASIEMEPVLSLRTTRSQHSGEVVLNWKPQPAARSYVIQTSIDGVNDWTVCGYSTRTQLVVSGLATLTNAWFRVSAIGTAGQGPWSETVKCLVI